MTDEIRLVLQLLTTLLLAVGLWILNSVSARIGKVESQIQEFDRSCEQRHSEMWATIRETERAIARVKGRMNGFRLKGE